MLSTWAIILSICVTPFCSGHLSFFGYYSQNRNDTNKEPTKIGSNNSINIFPSRSRPITRPIEPLKGSESSSKPFKYSFLPMDTLSTVSIKVPKSNISRSTNQFQYVSGSNQSISTSFGIMKTETSNHSIFPAYIPSTSNPIETAILPEHISNLTTPSQSVLTITQLNSTPSVVLKNETGNQPEQPESLAAPESVIDPIELTIFQKHEFEGEVSDSDECVNLTDSLESGQEIDEAKNCSSDTTTSAAETPQEIDESVVVESSDSNEWKKKNFNFTLESFIPPISELPKVEGPAFAKLPSKFLRLEPETVTLTNFIVKPSTVHVSQYASCLQLENVYSICDQNLFTIEPTNVLQSQSTMRDDELHYSLVRGSSDQNQPSSAKAHSIVDNVLEPGELDYEFEEISPEITPNLNFASVLQSPWTKVKEKAISGLKIKRIDVIIPSVTTKTHFDHGLTATVIAQNCVPPNLNIPFCTMFVYQIGLNVW